MNFSECPYQNLLSLDLKKFREGASTTSLGDMFQAFTTLFENTFARTFNLDRFLKSFRPLLCVDISSFILKNLSIEVYKIVNQIDCIPIKSALSLLYSIDGIPSFLAFRCMVGVSKGTATLIITMFNMNDLNIP